MSFSCRPVCRNTGTWAPQPIVLTQCLPLSSFDHPQTFIPIWPLDNEGDKICLFGFSRGAYTARALAGMLYKVGLLPWQNHQQIPFAYKMYKREDASGWKQSRAFKKTFSIDVQIEFIGVW